jgi:paraquat-inducible protein A
MKPGMADARANISTHYPREARRLRVILWITLVFLGIGLVAPVITLKKFVLIENTFSVLGGTVELLKEGHYFLFMVIVAFSIILPLLKIGVLYSLLCSKHREGADLERYLHWMHLYGKWSMLDVFIVAVLVVSVKLGAIASVEMRYGLYAFAAAVILTMYVTARVVSLADGARNAALKGHVT